MNAVPGFVRNIRHAGGRTISLLEEICEDAVAGCFLEGTVASFIQADGAKKHGRMAEPHGVDAEIEGCAAEVFFACNDVP